MTRVRGRKVRAYCTQCGELLTMYFGDTLGFDTEWVLCEECKPRVTKPRVTLYGAPEGQELRRWER